MILTRPKGHAHGEPRQASPCVCQHQFLLEDQCLRCGRLTAEAIRKAWVTLCR